jgi:hypothetical protein
MFHWLCCAECFVISPNSPFGRSLLPVRASETSSDEVVEKDGLLSPALEATASKFKILTCTSTSCAKRRKNLGMDPYSTFGAFYTRSKGDGDELTIGVEESPCLGSCKMAPCVAVEHEDFVGTVSLEGMTESEFTDRVYVFLVGFVKLMQYVNTSSNIFLLLFLYFPHDVYTMLQLPQVRKERFMNI